MIRYFLKTPFQSISLCFTILFSFICFILATQYLKYFWDFEDYFSQAEQIHRIETRLTVPGGEPQLIAAVPLGFSPWIKNGEWHHFTDVTSFYTQPVHAYANKRDLHQNMTYVDKNFVQFFDLPVALDELKSDQVVLSTATARKAFGKTDGLIGEPYLVPGIGEYSIAAILDVPENSHLSFELFALKPNPEPVEDKSRGAWTSFGEYFYIKTDQPSLSDEFIKVVNSGIDDYLGVQVIRDSQLESSKIWQFYQIPFKDIYFHSKSSGQMKETGDLRQKGTIENIVLVLIVVVVLITALSVYLTNSLRDKEIFVRQTLGDSHNGLLMKLCFQLIAILIGLGVLASVMYEPVLGYLNLLNDNSVPWLGVEHGLSFTEKLPVVFMIAVVCAIISVLFSINLFVFKQPNSRSGVSLVRSRIALFVLFLTVSGAGVAISFSSLFFWNYFELVNHDKGFDTSDVMVIQNGDIHTHFDVVADSVSEELKDNPNIVGAAKSSALPGRLLIHYEKLSLLDNPDYAPVTSGYISVDPDFKDVLGIEVLGGRFFYPDTPSEVVSATNNSLFPIIVSRKLSSRLGFDDYSSIIGKILSVGQEDRNATVIGVVDDWHFQQADRAEEPFALVVDPTLYSHLLIKTRGSGVTINRHIANVADKWLPSLSSQLISLEEIWSQQFNKSLSGLKIGMFMVIALVFNLIVGLIAIVSLIFKQNQLQTVVSFLSGASRKDLLWITSKSILLVLFISLCISNLIIVMLMNNDALKGLFILSNIEIKALLLNSLVSIFVFVTGLLINFKELAKFSLSRELFSE